ncbi:S9 family peptidase [Pleionea sp. CnH1-48]|uniref:S9 family peptidase n=1 Tax=Pleionea sp. CnH1-48 TaxID=2954494 RepID=UPI002097789D|nr:S9 family peptidase [Pleionea sp. CnH1-48]MCO7223961.1 S9 family peptidase [Pleionea sp. CnH1-48]
MMKNKIIGVIGLVSCLVLLPGYAKQLTVERIYSDPSLTGSAPRTVKLSPDGQLISYLKNRKDEQERLDLWAYDVSSKKHRMLVDSKALAADEELSDEEKARRERMRLFARGIVSYFWSPESDALVFPLAGDIYYYDLKQPANKAVRQLTKTDAYETDIKLSPKGHFISFIRQQNIFVIDLKSGKEIQLTHDGKGTIKNGMAEFVAQEEMSRLTGYWWSPDESSIAYTQIDESPVNVEKRYEINADSFHVFEQRYPVTGTPNVEIKLGVIGSKGGKTRWFDLGANKDIYLARVNWTKDSQQVVAQRQSRDQKRLDLISFNKNSGKQKTLLNETSDSWINIHDNLRFLKNGQFIWASEKSGFFHLYLHDANGKLVRQLTKGDWMVHDIKALNEESQALYFTATKKSPLEKHLYRLSLADKSPAVTAITQQEGVHEVTFSDNAEVYVHYFSAPEVPPQVSIRNNKGEFITYLDENKLDKTHPYWPYYQGESKAEFGTLTAADNKTKLYYRLYKPTHFKKGKRYPVIIDVYGGPGAQRVTKRWAARNGYWHKMMADRGFVVFSLDNRGSTNRGKVFEDALYRHLGKVEVEDQLEGVRFLKKLPYVDADNIGIFGWSYGGYMTLMSVMKHPDVFKAGVSVAPVTDWTLYDTHYTERYLGTPQNNAKGYELSNVFAYVDGLKDGSLLNVHGMADDNVLYTNSTKLYAQLQHKNKQYQMMDYPGSKHSIWGKEVRTHLFNTITEFFEEKLKK